MMFEIDLSALEEEVVNYGFDQFHDRMLDEEHLMNAIEVFMANEEYDMDYENQQFTLQSTVGTNILRRAMAEKISDIEWEVRHGERDDFTTTDTEFMREALRVAFD